MAYVAELSETVYRRPPGETGFMTKPETNAEVYAEMIALVRSLSAKEA